MHGTGIKYDEERNRALTVASDLRVYARSEIDPRFAIKLLAAADEIEQANRVGAAG